jgi:hypothetical protein
MRNYYTAQDLPVFEHIPLTFHVTGPNDEEFTKFRLHCEKNNGERDLWIVKPGENSNRGSGVGVFGNVESILQRMNKDAKKSRTFIIQKYLSNPLLIGKRKFDIRCFAMITSVNGFK